MTGKIPKRLLSQQQQAPDDLKLIIEGKKSVIVRIDAAWIPRWTFLHDLVYEMNPGMVRWSRTGLDQLISWIELNERMDHCYEEMGYSKYRKLLPISSMREVIDFMLPSSNDYLLFCYIDEDLPFSRRQSLYQDLGRLIRSNRLMFSYNRVITPTRFIHHNFYLASDPAYGVVKNGVMIPMSEYPEELRDAVLQSPLNVITGIVHTARSLVLSSHTRTEIKILHELPWDAIRWHDVLDMYTDSIDTLHEMIAEYTSDPRDATERIQVNNRRTNLYCLLAGRDPKNRDMTELPDTALIVTDRPMLRIRAPNPSLLLSRLIKWHRVTPPSTSIISLAVPSPSQTRNLRTETRRLQYLLPLLTWKMALNGSSKIRSIDSIEYSPLLHRINQTLGTEVVEVIASSVVALLDDTSGRIEAFITHLSRDGELSQLLRDKLASLGEAAVDLLESNDRREFASWPVIKCR